MSITIDDQDVSNLENQDIARVVEKVIIWTMDNNKLVRDDHKSGVKF